MPGAKQKYPDERFESLFRRFKKSVEKSNILKELRKYEFYEKPCEIRKRNKAAAKKRAQRINLESQMNPTSR